MKLKIYNFLVNKHPGIKERYHKFHDGAVGLKKYLSWLYLLWLNVCYYFLFCRFLGKKSDVAIYEEKKLICDKSESQKFLSETDVNVETFIKKLSDYDVVSFDIFDTLIFRPFSEPTDLFYFIGDKLGVMDFKRIRIEMEQKARRRCFEQNGHYEVTLREIWELIHEETGICAEDGMEFEMDMEQKFCYANPFMKKVYEEMQRQGKEIVIISDMYLPEEFLSYMLERNGYTGMKRIFVSCEYRKNKGSGTLFEYAVKEMNLSQSRIHVGDNLVGDVKMAKKYGFATCYYPNVNKNTLLYRPYDMSSIIGGAYRGIINNHIYDGIRAHSMEYEYGFIYGGLFVTGYCAFIHEYCKKNDIEKVLFLARDGDILKQAYEKMYPEDKTEYIYWSRRAATKLMAVCDKYDFYRRFLYHKVNQGILVSQILSSMDLKELSISCPKELRTATLTNDNVKQVKEFLEEHWDEILTIYSNEHRKAKVYFEGKLEGCQKVVAVDIGWAGSGAIAIRTLVEKVWKIQCEVIGIIAGTNTVHNAEPEASETFLQSGKLVSYLYSFSHNRELLKKHDPNKNYNVYWELLLSSPTQQFKGFGMQGLIFGAHDANQKGILEIQKGILDFVEMYCEKFKGIPYMFNISGRDAYAPMLLASSYDERYLKEIEKRFALEINIS